MNEVNKEKIKGEGKNPKPKTKIAKQAKSK